MNETEFLQRVAQLTEYRWTNDNGRIIGRVRNGRDRGKLFNPITALARSSRVLNVSAGGEHGAVATRKPETLAAARAIGLSTSVANAILDRSTNRGNAQVVRGRIKRAVGLL